MIKRLINQGVSRLRDAVATTRSGSNFTRTRTETYSGPYDALERLRAARERFAISTTLNPADADNGTLQMTFEEKGEVSDTTPPPDPVTEVIWQELRLPVTEHPAFAEITAERKGEIRKAAESEAGEAPTDTTEKKLYDLLRGGTTDYATGVPVVRRTSSRRRGNEGGGKAWFRDTPPGDAPAGYEWLKTADERRHDGQSFDLVEEWTGAPKWDDILYPAPEAPEE